MESLAESFAEVGMISLVTVEGSETYQVLFRDDDEDLAYDCICPQAADGYFESVVSLSGWHV